MHTSYPKEKIKFLLLESIHDSAIRQFRHSGYDRLECVSRAMSEDELEAAAKGVHILGIRSKTRVTDRILRAAGRLQAIGCFCIGVNQVDLRAATLHGVVVFNAPYSNTRSVAELVIGAAIMLIRRVPDKNKSAHEGIWMKDASGSYELRGKTIGIVGYGNIGSQVSVLAEALGMRVIYYDIESKLPLGNAESRKHLREVLSESDVVTIHVPETPQTKHLFNKTTLRQFKKGSVLINYSRGTVVDLDALRQHLFDGTIGGAAVDVFPQEPDKNGDRFRTPLQGLPNVLLTPHIGGSTEEAQGRIGEDVALKLLQFLEKGVSTGSHTVPPLALPLQEGTHRILHIHENVPGVLSEINTQLSRHGINILGQYLKTNDDIGYVVLDVNRHISGRALQLLRNVKHTIKTRVVY